MKEFIELLKAKGIVDTLQKTANAVPPPKNFNPEQAQEVLNEGLKECLMYFIHNDKEILKKFTDFGVDMALDAVVKELDIKHDPNADTHEDKLTKLLNILFN